MTKTNTVKANTAVKAVNTVKADKVKQDYITAHNIKVIPFNSQIHGKIDKQQIAVGLLILDTVINTNPVIALKLVTANLQLTAYYRHNPSGKPTMDTKHSGNRVYLVNGLKGLTDKASCHNTWATSAKTKLIVNQAYWQMIIAQYMQTFNISKKDIQDKIAKHRSAKGVYADYLVQMQKVVNA